MFGLSVAAFLESSSVRTNPNRALARIGARLGPIANAKPLSSHLKLLILRASPMLLATSAEPSETPIQQATAQRSIDPWDELTQCTRADAVPTDLSFPDSGTR